MTIPIDEAPALRAVSALFEFYDRPYWIAGGWAVDLRIGAPRRQHDDVDVMILERDLDAFVRCFAGNEFVVVDHQTDEERTFQWPTELVPGRDTLRFKTAPAPIEVLINKSDGDDWVFHRGGRIRRPLTDIGLRSQSGLPYLQPDLLLLFKARSDRAKDDEDFRALLPFLTDEQKAWLRPRLTRPGQPEHRWAPYLAGR